MKYLLSFMIYTSIISSAKAGEDSGGGLGSAQNLQARAAAVFSINLESLNFDQIQSEIEVNDIRILTTNDSDTYTPITIGDRKILLKSLDGKQAIINKVDSVEKETRGQLFFDPDQVTIEVDEENSPLGDETTMDKEI